MSIRYVCYNCSLKLKLSGFHAINEVGRKYCDRCGSNSDDLQVVSEEKYNKSMNADKK